MNFFNKKLNSEEYEKLSKKITELSADLNELSSKVRIIQSDNANLRGQFNRKLSGIKKDEDVEETQDINKGVLLPFDGNTFKFK